MDDHVAALGLTAQPPMMHWWSLDQIR